jgi:uncharacterized repeat protein (TIGR01451 family)
VADVSEDTSREENPAVVRMRLAAARATATMAAMDELPGRVNYFIGNDPKKWQTNIRTYAKVRSRNVYRGVDLVYYGNQQQLEYDFVVAPGADPKVIRFKIDAQDSAGKSEQPRLDADGDLVLGHAADEIRFRKPVVYQPAMQGKDSVEGHYALKNNEIGFEVAAYDHRRPLIIDPGVLYSTYLGGFGDDYGAAIAADSSGNAYVTGETSSLKFPHSPGALQGTNHGGHDAFVVKLNAAGSALIYSTYLGGSSNDGGHGIAVDASGSAYVTGLTVSGDFPTVNPLQLTSHGVDAFVAKLNADGSALVYSTYLGGSGSDGGSGIAVDASGNAYVTGGTGSTDFPTVNPLQPTNHGGGDAFVLKLNAAGSALVYSTYLGGSGYDGGSHIAVDTGGNAYVAGGSQSTDFPTVNPLQPTNHGNLNAFVAKLNASGSALVYSTYLGGSGSNFDAADGIAVDAGGNAYVVGFTSSTDFPTVDPLMPQFQGGNYDAFVAKLNADGSALVYSTYLGGSNSDVGQAIAVDGSGNIYVTGYTNSTNFPTAYPLEPNYHAQNDAFVVKIVAAAPAADLQITNSAPSTVTSGSTLTYTITVTNLGPDAAVKVTITDRYPSGTTFNSVAISTGQCSTGGKASICRVRNLASGNTVTETLTVNVTVPVGSTINDSATVSSFTFDSNEKNNAATATTKVM